MRYILFIILLTESVLFSVDSYRQRRRRIRNIQEGAVRLVNGRNSYEGNVEVYHLGIWGSVCDDEWDITEANVICRSIGFSKAAKATQNGEFGRGRKKIWMDNLYCEGHEKRLQDCRFDGWGSHDCSASEAAGVVCESKNATKFESLVAKKSLVVRSALKLEKTQNIEVRLVGGRYPNEGRVEVRIGKSGWGLVCGDGWSLLEANVICQQLQRGYGEAAVQSSYFGGHHKNISISGIKCTGREKNLSACSYVSFGDDVSCPGPDDNIAGVICAKELPDLVPDEIEIERSAYLEDRQLLFLQCAMEENCLASEAYKLDKNDYGYLYEQRRLLRFTARIGNIGTTDFRPFLPKNAWQWHMCHLHYHSMEVFAHFDIINLQGQKVAEGHKASFCLEDNNCLPGIEKKYACANYGDQGISVGCSDTYLHTVDCQWVDITDLQPGVYKFKVSINPEFKVAELNYDNNAAVCNMFYNAVSVRIFNCTLQRP
ncbi:lysyl oxidase homolog 2-like isoform X1 [Argiope bruennichi]|uniref:lysyl oxidase homolog 2-like isoform X1 n=1 Tax=Argiope bruennichi TaxID=94029 RepID=UPI002494634C|nr:lysyl oxidase homolog 2-like isoform X1 [Argiope bruennichi]